MRKELLRLRKLMEEHGLDLYLIPTTDRHGSEYVNDHFKCREFVSGFTGSAGTLLVGREDAWLWTDGRYFLQAGDQLSGSGIELMKMEEPGIPDIYDHLKTLARGGMRRLGLDGYVISVDEGEKLKSCGLDLMPDLDLVGDIWDDRPKLEPAPIYPIPLEVTGEDASSKLARVRADMEKAGADYLLLTSLEEIAWLYNLRGADVDHTPVFFAYSLVSRDEAKLFVYPDRIKDLKGKPLGGPGLDDSRLGGPGLDDLTLCSYFDIVDALKALPADALVWFNPTKTSYLLEAALEKRGGRNDAAGQNDADPALTYIRERTPVCFMKAIKNETEILSEINAHTRDGVSMTRFIHWLKTHPDVSTLNEIFVSDYLRALRLDHEECYDISFETICGYGPNGAVIHYGATPETNAQLAPEGFLLVDSGGQYDDGTTDITRTIALGPLSRKMKEHFTAVLKSHIALSSAVFPHGTTGYELDVLTRKPMNDLGLDYNHGTGHGVGHLLSVHEGPQNIGKREGALPIEAGMICSDEPGVYVEGEFGVRLENEILCFETDGPDGGTHDSCDSGLLAFRPITFCPFEREAILPEMLTEEELEWLNGYHAMVRDVLSPFLPKDVSDWLAEATAPVHNTVITY